MADATGRALLLYGGWEGHAPEQFARFAREELLGDYDVVSRQSLEALTDLDLADFDLLLPIWTFGELSTEQEKALLGGVQNGLGYVGWHGNASSFLACRAHKHLLGGQFVDHPGGNHIDYKVSFCRTDPLVNDLPDFSITSEQYYLLVDPAVNVLATAPMDGGGMPWLRNVEMPVAWKRRWGRGRVFYISLGHTLDTLQQPPVTTLLRRAIAWARRDSAHAY